MEQLRAYICKIILVIFALFGGCKNDVYALNLLAQLFGGFGGFSSNFSQNEPDRDYQLSSISFSSYKNSNDGIATQLDLVMIYDSQLASDLSQRTAREYFSMVDQLKYDYRGKLAILEWEIPAENRISKPYNLRCMLKRAKPKLILIFANMMNKKSAHRYQVAETDTKLHIIIDKNRIIFGNRGSRTGQNMPARRGGNMLGSVLNMASGFASPQQGNIGSNLATGLGFNNQTSNFSNGSNGPYDASKYGPQAQQFGSYNYVQNGQSNYGPSASYGGYNANANYGSNGRYNAQPGYGVNGRSNSYDFSSNGSYNSYDQSRQNNAYGGSNYAPSGYDNRYRNF